MKKFLALLLALSMTLALAACGSKESASQPSGSGAASTPTPASKIEVNVIAAQYGSKTGDWWKGFEEKFEKANENIDLVVDVVSWNDI